MIAWMLGGPEREYSVPLPAPGEPLRAILRSYTKEHSAEYQAQALIDLGFALHQRRLELEKVREVVIRTSHHTHYVIGTGSKDPQKMDPDASRETLDHSAMYILAVAWEDGAWHHVHSYTPERAHRPSTVRLWRQIRTEEVAEWTAAYHATNPDEKKFGAEVVVVMADGTRISERLDNPNAHYLGKKPFSRPDYVRKLRVLSEGLAAEGEIARFVGLVERLPELSPAQVRQLNPVVMAGQVEDAQSDRVGLF